MDQEAESGADHHQTDRNSHQKTSHGGRGRNSGGRFRTAGDNQHHRGYRDEKRGTHRGMGKSLLKYQSSPPKRDAMACLNMERLPPSSFFPEMMRARQEMRLENY